MERLNASLKETGLLREEFMAILGHDLRNPLASIASGVRYLKKEQLTPKGVEVAGLVESSVSRMGKLIDDILDLARGRLGGGIPLKRTLETGLHLALEQVVAELASSSGRMIETVIDLPEAVMVDSHRIAQLGPNLLGNAVAHGDPEQPITLWAAPVQGDLVISVANGGEPIPPEVLERLFQPFFRGGSSATNHQHGLGLGLHIAGEIARAHGGTLSVTSTGEKTTFEFRMPISLSSGAAFDGTIGFEE